MKSFSDYKFEDMAVPCYILTSENVFVENEIAKKAKNNTLSEYVEDLLQKHVSGNHVANSDFIFYTTSEISLQRHNILISFFKHGLLAVALESEHFPVDSFGSSVRGSLSNVFATLPLLGQKSDESAYPYIEDIQKNCYEILRLTNNLETIETLEKNSYSKKSFDVASEIETILKSISTIGLKDNIQITSNLPHTSVCVKGNQNLFTEALLNILRNSIQFSRDGNSISVVLVVKGKRVIITIRDRGIGIKEDNILKVFEPHFSVDPYGDTTERPGLGIGLSNAKKIMESLGGIVALESRFGEGTTITISLPLDESFGSSLRSSPAQYLLNRYSPVYIHLAGFYNTSII